MKVFQSLIINSPINDVWDFVSPFNSPLIWNPGVVDIVMEGNSLKEIGVKRHLKIHDGTVFLEELIEYSNIEHFYTYKILSCPLNIQNYIATQKFIEITEGAKTLAIWQSEFDCHPDIAEELMEYFSKRVYLEGMTGIKNHMQSNLDIQKK
jgi:hypothetical protein